MPSKKKPSPSVPQEASDDRNISIGGDVVDSVVIAGDGNKVNIIQKFFNIFKTDAETVDQRNRRIMLGHVENFWVKGILEKSLHGAALLELGIKEDPDALTYPWAIKREANKETLPAGTSMLEIFQEIGMGRSLLILGAPGSGKTTMLLELTRQLIERAREDVIEPIPVVFNLSSWTEKLSLADWLARELNVIYTIPKKTAPTWVKENKMLLLLDGLDEVRQESRDKCVDAINQFKKENGLTSLAVCSRIQDYAERKTKLAFDGAIEIQPLTSNQVDVYFKRFGKGLAGIRQVLEKDTVLRETAETPLFLSIMTFAYRDTQTKDISVSENLDFQRKHLFNTYIQRMFERPERSKNEKFEKQDVLQWLTWLSQKMIAHNAVPYLLENMQPSWLSQKKQGFYKPSVPFLTGLLVGLLTGLFFGLFNGLLAGLTIGLSCGIVDRISGINMVDALDLDWKKFRKNLFSGLIFGLLVGLVHGLISKQFSWLSAGMFYGLFIGLFGGIFLGLITKSINQTTYPGQRISFSIKSYLIASTIFGIVAGMFDGLFFGMINGLSSGLINGLFSWLCSGLAFGLFFGGLAIIQHYLLLFFIASDNFLPWRIIPFLDYCVDLIFLRRVGGGYIFVHRLLMEHFAAMYTEET